MSTPQNIIELWYSVSLFYGVHFEALDPKHYKLLPIAYSLLPRAKRYI